MANSLSAPHSYEGLTSRNDSLAREVQGRLNARPDIEWHDWLHFKFVARKSIEFAQAEGFDPYATATLEGAALVHDLNYLVKTNTGPEAGTGLRQKLLREHGFEVVEGLDIERWVIEAHTATRGADISPPAQILSDADTLYKALPFRPILDGARYIRENGITPQEWAKKIIDEQRPLMDEGIYFYTEAAKVYLPLAEANLRHVGAQLEMMLSEPETWNAAISPLATKDPDTHAALTLLIETPETPPEQPRPGCSALDNK